MPRVHLTEADRHKAKQDKVFQALRDGLVLYKGKNRLTNTEFGNRLGVSEPTVRKLLKAEPTCMSVKSFLIALELAGLEVRKVDKE